MNYTVVDLRKMAKEKSIKGYSGMKKEALIRALGFSNQKLQIKNSTKEPCEFSQYSKKELYDLAKKRNIAGRSKLNKEELCAILGIGKSRKTSVKKQTPKKNVVKKQTPKKTSVRKQTPKKTSIKKQTPKKSPVRKQTPKKSPVKKQTPKKSPVRKQAPKKSVAKKSIPEKETSEGSCISNSNMKLRNYQIKPVEYITKEENKGIVIAFDVGSGKTITAVTATKCIMDQDKSLITIVITPTSLQDNFKTAMLNYGLKKTDPRYIFYTPAKFNNIYSYKKGSKDTSANRENKKEHLKLLKLLRTGNFILVIDEAHNYKTTIHPRVPFFKKLHTRAEGVIKVAKKAKKVILLTATPIYNDLIDLANIMAMVRQEPVLTEQEFDNLIEYDKSIKKENINTFINKLKKNERAKRYFECIFNFHKKVETDTNYPTVRYHDVNIVMSKDYYKKYRAEELKEGRKKKIWKGLEDVESKAFYNNLRSASVKFYPNKKIDAVVQKIKEGGKTLVYSSYLRWGINKIKENLPKNIVKKSVTISGSVDKKEREEIVKKYNEGKINVLFITKAGAEGLDLKGVRNVVIFERNWNKSVELQVIGRAVRNASHTHLPKNEQFVDVYFYDLEKPSRKIREEAVKEYNRTVKKNYLVLEEENPTKAIIGRLQTVDGIMKELGEEKDLKIQAFTTWLESISIGSKHCENK
jgi:superfamily II DNA or RNA helicase